MEKAASKLVFGKEAWKRIPRDLPTYRNYLDSVQNRMAAWVLLNANFSNPRAEEGGTNSSTDIWFGVYTLFARVRVDNLLFKLKVQTDRKRLWRIK